MFLDQHLSFKCRIPETVEERSSWFHRWREDWRIPEETRNFLHARNGTKESGQCLLLSHLLDIHSRFPDLNRHALNYFTRNKGFQLLTLNFDIFTLLIKHLNWCPLCFWGPYSYQCKRGRSKVGRERDTSRPTTTIWQVSWRTIQMVSLWRSESLPLSASGPRRTDRRWQEMETLATLRYKDFFMANKLASFPFFALLSVISGPVFCGVNSNCVVESFLVYWSVITEGHGGKEHRPLRTPNGATTLLLNCVPFVFVNFIYYNIKECVRVWKVLFERVPFHSVTSDCIRRACVVQCITLRSLSHHGTSWTLPLVEYLNPFILQQRGIVV